MKQSPRWLYEEVYCQRSDVENRIKELKALDVDRTSCTNFWANQLRVPMAAAAYVPLQEIRLNAALTSLARAQVWTLCERLLKLGAMDSVLSAPHRRASAGVVPLAKRFSEDRHGSGRDRRITSRQDHKDSISQEQPKILSSIAMSEMRRVAPRYV
jgi:hypothetical protein